MKIFIFPTLLLFLTSCKVNWLGSTLEWPWWAVVIPIAIILVVSHILILRTIFVCPKCGENFKPRFYEISAWMHWDNKRVCKCPKCGHKGFCPKKPR